MSRLSARHVGAAGAALLALATAFISTKEGTRTHAYRDSVGIATICTGETKGVRMGMVLTKAQCAALFDKRLLADFMPALEACVPDARDPAKMSDRTYVAFLSMAYNIGSGGFCRSTPAHLWNAGDHAGACHAMLRYDRAGGRVLHGLELRRDDEERLCLEGLG